MAFTKADLVQHIAGETGIRRTDADKVVETFIDAVQQSLTDGYKITLVGFGTLSVFHRSARTGRNPRTKEPIPIPSSNTIKFKPGAGLKTAVGAEGADDDDE